MEQLSHPRSYSQHVIGQGKSLHCHCKQTTSGPEHVKEMVKEMVPAVQMLLKSLYLTLSIDINFQY